MAYYDTNYTTPGEDAVSRRRFNVSRAVRPSWDVPSDFSGSAREKPGADGPPAGWVGGGNGWTPPAPGGGGAGYRGDGGYGGSSGDVLLDNMRNGAYADAAGRVRGARLSASGQVGADPSLSAYAGLNALISGQGDAAHDVNRGALEYLMAEKKRRDSEAMLRLQSQLQEELQRRMNSGAWLGDLGQLAGTLGGAWLGGPGGAALANRVTQ